MLAGFCSDRLGFVTANQSNFGWCRYGVEPMVSELFYAESGTGMRQPGCSNLVSRAEATDSAGELRLRWR